MALTKRQVEIIWAEFRDSILNSTPVDHTETVEQQRRRIAKLEADDEAWFKYYFPQYAFAEPADFHKAATRRIMNNPEWYEVRAWSRELAKSTRTMMEVLKLVLTGKKRYVSLSSADATAAGNLLEPYRSELDTNARIIQDYGIQESISNWAFGEFSTRKGAKFKAFGAGQAPRGTKNKERRPDVLLYDDMDTDEDCRNPEQVKKKWQWIENASIGTRSISAPTLILFCGNIIAKDCCVVRAMPFADHVDIINIRDDKGKSSWPQKNTEAHIDRVLSQKSYLSQQREYFNNPVEEGTVFKEMYYKTLPPLSQYKFLVCYVDLSYKSTAKNDYKAAVLMGRWKDEYHIRKAFLKQGTTRELAIGLQDIQKYVGGKCPVYWLAEENFIQDIILKELHQVFQQLKSTICIVGDKRKKPDKFTRIESTLEPLNSNGKLWLNEAERDSPHMKTLEGQFTALGPGSKTHDDGPDASEGAKHIIDLKFYQEAPMTLGARKTNAKRF